MSKLRESYAEVQTVRYSICVTPPRTFWRWTALRKAIELYLDHIGVEGEVDMFKMSGTYDPYMNRVEHHETDLPYITGSFGVVVEGDYGQVLPIDRIKARLDHMVYTLDTDPTMAEKDWFLRDFFEKWGYCDDCGGDERHHTARYAEGKHFSEDGSHWEVLCHWRLSDDNGFITTETSAIRDERIARLERGESFLGDDNG